MIKPDQVSEAQSILSRQSTCSPMIIKRQSAEPNSPEEPLSEYMHPKTLAAVFTPRRPGRL